MLSIKRVEHKFFINNEDIQPLIQLLKTVMFLDVNSPNATPYKISSLYFDTEFDDDLKEKLDGVRYREKYRVRIYNDNEKYGKFEIKRKIENTIQKVSFTIGENEIKNSYVNNNDYLLNNELTAYVYTKMKYKNYSPKTIVTYDRIAFTLPFDNIRITLDLNIRTHDYTNSNGLKNAAGHGVRIIPKGFQIIEIKYFNELPYFIKQILSEFDLSKTAISKYSAGRLHSREELNGDVPYFAY